MTPALLLSLALVSADASGLVPPGAGVFATTAAAPAEQPAASENAAAFVDVVKLVDQAERSYLVQRWDRAIENFEQAVAANPTIGYVWYRLATCRLMAGQFEPAIAAFQRAHELGAYQWHPLKIVYHGESAWGIAAANARLGRRDEALRWTRIALDEGLRDIRQFHGKHFKDLLQGQEFRKLVWADGAKEMARDEGFRHDLRFVMHEAKRIHYAPFRLKSEAELDSMAAALDADIPQLNDDQILVRFAAILRCLGDGHTHVHRTGPPRLLGVRLQQYPEGLYVEAAQREHADLIGAKVLRIGDRSADEALELARSITSYDNEMNVRSIAPWLLGSLTLLRGLGICSGDGPVPVEIEDAKGEKRRVELPIVNKPNHDANLVYAVPGCETPLPICMRSRGKIYWFETMPAERLVFCQFNGIGNDGREPLDKFCQRLLAAVDQPEIDALVLDMRYNGGGDTFTITPLIEGLIRSEKLQQPGRLFVIIGRRTFSAAQNTTSELERRTKAILVGEPTGSNPNFIGESIAIPLPYSGWVMSLSDLWWQHSMAMDYRVWTHPQLYAPPTAAALRAHRDPAMEAILAYRAAAK
ncbi:MAG: tetratricopeptide repeat protein [Pirellulales bacterium]